MRWPDIPRWLLTQLGRVLYLWTRTQVFTVGGGEYRLDPALPVCYVLQQKHWSNLMVLDHECQVRNLVPALAPLCIGNLRHPRSYFFLQNGDGSPASNDADSLLAKLVDAARGDPAFEVQLVPVTILWGRAPGTQDSILKALFAETWQATSSLRQILTIMIHGRQTVVRFDPPGSLRKLVTGDADTDHVMRRVSRVLRMHFHRERSRAIGPDLSHRNTQLRSLLASREVREAIASEALTQSISFTRAEATARRYALEIASDFSYTITQALMLVLDWVASRVFDGVDVHNFDTLEKVPAGSTLIYVPCHRSYMDAALLNHFLYRRGVTFPHAVAGANLNVPVAGTIFRGVGAFFLRRKIKGNALYSTIFNEYLHRVIDHGFPIQYYIEGGRSRSGCLLTPRTGMLGMTVRSYLRSRNRPLVFVPIYFGYEKLMEGSSYLAEFGGTPKKGESLGGMIRALRTLARRYGRVHVNFGQPLVFSPFMDKRYPAWRQATDIDSKAPWLRAAVRGIGTELARRINAAAVVHPVNYLALTLLSTPKRCADLRAVERQIAHLHYLVGHCGLPVNIVTTGETPAAMIELGIAQDLISVRSHPLGDLIHATELQAGALAYPRNNVIHVFALPSLLARLVSANLILSRLRAHEAIKAIYGLLQAELFLPWDDDELDGVIVKTENALLQRGLILYDEVSGSLRARSPQRDENAELAQLGEIIRATLERQFLTITVLQQYGTGRLMRAQLEESAHLLSQRLSDLYEFNTPDFSERALFAGSVGNLIEVGLLQVDDSGYLCFDARISIPATQAELLLGTDVRHSIERLARANPV